MSSRSSVVSPAYRVPIRSEMALVVGFNSRRTSAIEISVVHIVRTSPGTYDEMRLLTGWFLQELDPAQ